ncbi:hypothetical protein EJB05_30929, partial [Eragrostis curvula]
MKLSAAVLCALVAVQAAVLLASVSSAQADELEVGYYNKKCRGVENVIKWHVIRAIKAHRRTGAALVRLLFHDCFVRVSTQHIPHTDMHDSLCSNAELPDSVDDVEKLIKTFAKKNFTVEELVILTGAHSIGQGHCSSFRGRLTEPASQITPAYQALLNYKCPQGSDPVVDNNVRDEDYNVVAKYMPGFTSRVRKIPDFLDNSFYHNTLAKIVTFHSDWTLLTHEEALGHVHEYADNATLWDEDFADSMLKLSKLPMPAGSKGEIRKKCNIVNHRLY